MSMDYHQNDLPFDHPPPPTSRPRRKRGADRRISDASVENFELVKARRSKLYLPILDVIATYGPEIEKLPTAREILRELIARGVLPPSAERNQVSPRLSELLDDGCVDNPIDEDTQKLFLKVIGSDASASVWMITDKGKLFLNRLREEARKDA